MQKIREKALDLYARVSREEGQGMVEYGLILFLVSIAAIVLLTQIGFDVSDVFDAVEGALGGGDATDPSATGTVAT